MSIFAAGLRYSINVVDRCFGLRKLMRVATDPPTHPLAGDRAIEWSWVTVHLPAQPCHVLDVGCVGSVLTGIASRFGHMVCAVDLRDIEYEMPRVEFRKGDVCELDFADARFDIIMNCSTVEHVGLRDRYASTERPDGDLVLMRTLNGVLAPGGRMILTVPVGRDATIAPYHRIYGAMRLPRLLDNYGVLEEEYWTKGADGLWRKCDRAEAMSTRGSADHYALGLFVLEGSETGCSCSPRGLE